MNKRYLTKKKFWVDYWRSRRIRTDVGSDLYFSSILKKCLSKETKSFIEIGGFPGLCAIYAKKYLNLDSTLLDYFIDEDALTKILKENGLSRKEVRVIKSDFLKYGSRTRYDIVFSSGFIEHFDNPSVVIRKHWRMVSPGGKMVITYPNFLSLNGHMQLLFNPSVFDTHNIQIMVIKNVEKMLRKLNIKARVFYFGGFGLWLENLDTRPSILKILVFMGGALGLVIRKLGFNTKLTSPHIVIIAQKPR